MSQVRNLKLSETELIIIDDNNLNIYINLARSYEAEFSSLTHKLPNEAGIFEIDTLPVAPYIGYLLYKSNIPIGFCVIEISEEMNDVAEFYIIPSMRKNKYGDSLAAKIFEIYPGKWQVRQIEGANAAKSFWRSVINKFTQNNYEEESVNDPEWGMITRQQFFSIGSISNANEKNFEPHTFFAASESSSIKTLKNAKDHPIESKNKL
jgi:predicted acetyltransferase